MKKIFYLILLAISLNAQTYTEQWAEITELDKKSLPKSALDKVEIIYQKAKESGDENQLIKALLYKNRYIRTLKESGWLDSIKNIEKEIESTTKPTTKLILKSILAEMYAQYVHRFLYKIEKNYNDRGDSIEKWSLRTLLNNISKLYIESISDEAKSVKIEKYNTILSKQENSEGLRPTLYDFLAFRALEYFNNNRSYLTKPIYNFYIKDREAFGTIQTFIDHNFKTSNRDSFKYKTILIYQELLRFHRDRGDSKALQHINLERINFVYNNFVGDSKERYYIDALNSLESQMHSEAIYYLAKYYYQKNDYIKAMSYAKRGIKSRDKFLSQRCLYIKKDIEWQSIEIDMEKVNLPNENILAKLSYRNIDRVFIKVIKTTDREIQKINSIEFQSRDEYIRGLESINEFNISLPIADDYKQHRTEISLGSYGYGHYIFLISKDREFGKFSKSFSAISKISYFHKNSKLLVVDRASGEPLEGVEAKLYLSKYNRRTQKRKREFISTKTSDKDGIIHLPKIEYEYEIILKYGEDSLNFARGSSFDREYNQEQKRRETLHIFTDRAIYRPAQTIYFKGLAVSQSRKSKPKILTNREIEVTLYGTNRQKIETKKLTTNEFGTINGFFTLPKRGYMGSMYISSNIGGHKRVRVEEYKRPKFEVLFDKLDSSYRLGDSITLKGTAKAYAGNSIDGATVKYSIRRVSSFPWCETREYNSNPYRNNPIISRGETKTDKNGQFKIEFKASVDESISADKKPNYSYTVSVDITDTTGETQSSSKTVNLGFVAINASMIIDSEISIDSNKSLKLKTTNLDGKFEPLKGKIVIERLKNHNRIYRDRYWSSSDIDMHIYDRDRFQKLFRNYRPVGEVKEEREPVSTIPFDTEKSKEIALGRLAQGRYILTLYTNDKYGTEVKKSKNITIYDLNASTPPYQTQLWDKIDKNSYKIGSTATIYIKSSSPDSYVFLSIERDKKIVKQRWIKLSNLNRELVKIGEKDRGDIFYHLTMVKNNRQYGSIGTIKVPWSKKLKVEYRSFRDRLKPNQNEQWSIKISGEGKEKIVAEMVATMYDASLDEFVKHNFNIRNLFPKNYSNYQNRWQPRTFSILHNNIEWAYDNRDRLKRLFPHLNNFNNSYIHSYSDPYSTTPRFAMGSQSTPTISSSDSAQPEVVYENASSHGGVFEEIRDEGGMGGDIMGVASFEPKTITVRKNLKETIFFKPNLQTDKNGDIVINFKTNEALTRWKFLGFIHTKELDTAITQREIITQKELMVVTNLPRFFREGDIITLSAKVVNISEKDLEGTCQLLLVNPKNGSNIYGDHNFTKRISLKKGASTDVSFKIKIPPVNYVPTMKHTIIAKTNLYSDAEEVIKPILSNREFITESKVLSIKGKESKSFTLESLKNNNSSTLKNHKLTLEFTSNPIWYAIKSLPYLMEYPHECNEQIFNRYFANALASKIANSTPKIKKIFDSWRSRGKLKSPLNINPKLKSLLLEESPWVLEAQTQEEQQKNLALLFDLHRLAKESKTALSKLKEQQNRDGGWDWFNGGKSDWYITQYIVERFGKLKELGVENKKSDKAINRAIMFIDRIVRDNYKRRKEAVEKGKMSFDNRYINSITIHYLYARSLYDLKMDRDTKEAYNYNLSLAEKQWREKSIYEQGLIALTLYKKGKRETAKDIVKSLKERAIVSDELGMYFRYKNGFYWNESPIETHTLMIDVFNTISDDKKSVEQLKIWLLKNRQTTHWKTTKATASAISALLTTNDSWLSNDKLVNINFDTKVKYQPILEKAKASAQKGSGYFKVNFDKFNKDMATVRIKNPNSNIAWGGLYWQYFEDLDKIKNFKETPLSIDKRLYLIKGERNMPIDSQTILKVGDKIRVQLTIKSDRDMEYLMLKDSRASAFEPTNVLSQYKWQSGLGYYESTKDNATYFFVDRLKRGTYILEYTLFVTHKGSFSNGIATIESMYAPEFKSHSKGERINVK